MRRHTQLPDSGNDDSCIYTNRTSFDVPTISLEEDKLDIKDVVESMASDEIPVEEKNKELEECELVLNKIRLNRTLQKIEELEKKNVSVVCELTKPETVVAAPVQVENVIISLPVKEDDSLAISAAKANLIQKKHQSKSSTEKSMMSVTKKHEAKFKVAKSVTVKKDKTEKSENLKSDVPEKTNEVTIAASLLEDVMEQLNLDDKKNTKVSSSLKFDLCKIIINKMVLSLFLINCWEANCSLVKFQQNYF